MTYSWSSYLYDILVDPWHVCMYVWAGGTLIWWQSVDVQIVLSECYKLTQIKFSVYQQLTDSDSCFGDIFLYLSHIFICFVCYWMSRVLYIFDRNYGAFELANHSRICILPILCSPTANFNVMNVSATCFHILKQNLMQKYCLPSLSFYRFA